MPTIEPKKFVVRCNVEFCDHNQKGFCNNTDDEIMILWADQPNIIDGICSKIRPIKAPKER